MELTLVAALLGSALLGAPGPIPLEKITDSTILPPGVTGTILLGSSPDSCLGNVFFAVLDEAGRLGLYAATPQGLTVIANHTTPVPGSMSTFQRVTRLTCAGDKLFFLGKDDLGPMSGGSSIYSYAQGSISLVFEVGTPIGSTFFEGFNSLDVADSDILVDAILSPASTNEAIVVIPFGESPMIVADITTVLPGQTDPATIYSRPVFVGADVFFHARTATEVAIYRWREGEGITVIADTTTPVSVSGQGTFVAFGIFADLGGRFVFGATFLGGLGIFAFEDGQFEPVVLPGDMTADGATFFSVSDPRGAGNLLTFAGRTQEDGLLEAVFVKEGDGLPRRLLGVGDTFEGREVHRIASNADHRDVLVWAENLEPPGFQAIYRARFGAAATDIPVLSWWGVLVLGAGLAVAGWWTLGRLLTQ